MSDLLKLAKPAARVRMGEVWDALVVPNASVDFTYDDLKKLADASGSTDINVVYEADDPGYSEYTPGTSSDFEIVVWLRKAIT